MNLSWEASFPTPFASSPLLPLLLISLAQQKHSPDTANIILTEYDYVIVGAGSAGSVVANRLSEVDCIKVLLLEAGQPPPRLTDVPAAASSFLYSDIDWQYRTVPQKYTGKGLVNREVPWPSGKTIGGTSVLNAMYAVRGNRRNYDDWADQGADGWSYEEVLPYFKKLEDYMVHEDAGNGFHGFGGPQTIEIPQYKSKVKKAFDKSAILNGYEFIDANGPSQIGFSRGPRTIRNGQRCSAAKAYLVPAENRTNLDILPNATATKIIIKNRRATAVRFIYNHQTHEVRAKKEVIICAGAVESSKLLMLSGIGPSEELKKFKIDLIADLPVGENMQDHIGVPFSFVLDEEKASPCSGMITNSTIMQYIKRRSGPLSIGYGATTTAFLRNLDSRNSSSLPDYQLYFAEITVDSVRRQWGMDQQFFDAVYRPYRDKPTFVCISEVLNAKSRGVLRLRSTCPFDKPLIDPRYFEHPEDLYHIIAGMKTCLRLGTSQPLLELGSQPFKTIYPGCEPFLNDEDGYLRCMAETLVFTMYHKSGTAKMGRISDPTTVVDPQLRVKSIKNLRVIDASIIPTITSGNINLPVMMIAEKASDMIKETISCNVAW